MNDVPTFTGTLCLLVKDNKVLLFDKVRKIGAGCKNAPGGNREEDETYLEAALRELKEECEVVGKAESTQHVATITFHNAGKFTFVMPTYILTDWEGEPQETDELKNPQWFDFDSLPFNEMLQADKVWLPEVLAGKKVLGEFWYIQGPDKTGPNQMILDRHEVGEVERLPDPDQV